jgi:hypothetical protein
VQVCWEVFLDDESLLKFQNEQKEIHAQRIAEFGAPGYVDKTAVRDLELTLFQESGDVSRKLKAGQKVSVAPAGVDRAATAPALTGTVSAAKMAGNLGKVTVTLDTDPAGFQAAGLARLWLSL